MTIDDNKLLELIDGMLSNEEESQLHDRISADPLLRSKYEFLQSMDRSIASGMMHDAPGSLGPSVMKSIKEMQSLSSRSIEINKWISLILLILTIGTIILFLATSFHPYLFDASQGNITIRNFSFDLGPVLNLFNSVYLFKIIFYMTGVIGLFLFEHAVLKPFFERRKHRISQ